MSKFAWVTLTTNDTYSLGALVLANSLKRVGTAHQLAVLVTPNVSDAMKSKLKDTFNVVQEVDVLDSKDEANLALFSRPELGITFTKLHCWRLVQFEKCVFLDADILVLKNCDELFEREELSASPDISWPDCFNSGVYVYRPSLESFNKLVEFAVKNGSFDGGDQGLLNTYFSDWATGDNSKRLPFTYNTIAFASYSYLPAFKQFRDRIKILHFAGRTKPWLASFDSQHKRAHPPKEYEHAAEFIQLWWTIFCDDVHHGLQNTMMHSSSGRYYEQHNFPIISDTISNSIIFHDPWEDYYEKLENYNIYDINSYDNNNFNDITFKNIFFNNDQIVSDNNNTIPNNIINNNNNNYNDNKNISSKQNKNQTNNIENIVHNVVLDYYKNENSNVEIFEDNNINLNKNNSDNNNCYNETIKIKEKKNDNENFFLINNEQNINDKNNKNEKILYRIPTPPPPPPPLLPPSPPSLPSHQSQINLQEPLKNQEKQQESQETIQKFTEIKNFENINNEKSKNINNNFNNLSDLMDSNNLNNYNKNSKNLNEVLNNEDIINEQKTGLAGVLSTLRLGEAKTPEQEAYEQAMRRQCWESGNIDYAGKDSFDNIWKKISQTIDSKPKSDTQESASM